MGDTPLDTKWYSPEPTLNMAVLSCVRTNFTPFAFDAGLPLSVMAAALTAGRRTSAVVFAGMAMSRVRTPSASFQRDAISP